MFMLWLLISRCCSSQTVNLHSNLCWTCFGVSAPGGSGLCCRRFEIHAASVFRIETNVVFIGNPIYFNLQTEAACSYKYRQRILLPRGTSIKKQVQHQSYSLILVWNHASENIQWSGEDFILSWPYFAECEVVVRLRPTVLNEIFMAFFFHLLHPSV